MKVTWPDIDFQAWQPTLTDWQRRALVEVARGEYHKYDHHVHHRIQVVVTDYGFDLLGLKRVTAFHSDGSPVEDAWQLTWVCEVGADYIHHGDWERKYGTAAPRRTGPRFVNDWDRPTRRRHARWRRRERKREERQRAKMQARLDELLREQAEWVGSPYSFPHYDEIGHLQQMLGQEVTDGATT